MTEPHPEFITDRLDCEFDCELPEEFDDTTFPDLYVGLDIDLLAPGDGILTDRHHASADRYEADDAMNQIGGQISSFALSGALRHSCERVHQIAGATACHPGEANANYMREDVYHRDLENGYHEKGSCVDSETHGEHGCLIYGLFGGFGDRAGRLIRHPIGFSPIRRQVDVTKGEAEAHYRQLHTQVRSRNAEDEGQTLRHATRDVVANLEGTWKLTLRELRPEYVGLLIEAVDYLDTHSDNYEMQIGGARNFGAGIADATIINPLYTKGEVRRVYNRAKKPTSAMQTKDDVWADSCRPAFVRALQARISEDDGALPPAIDGDTGYDNDCDNENDSDSDNDSSGTSRANQEGDD